MYSRIIKFTFRSYENNFFKCLHLNFHSAIKSYPLISYTGRLDINCIPRVARAYSSVTTSIAIVYIRGESLENISRTSIISHIFHVSKL